jgi:hypothetical protein
MKGETLTLEEQREAASLLFPEAWAATLVMPGWRRRRRQAGLRKAAVAELLPPDASCANCSNRGRRGKLLVCELDSDFHGYVVVQADARCHRWSR